MVSQESRESTHHFKLILFSQNVDKFLAGKLSPFIHSQKAPTQSEIAAAAPVQIVTGLNFHDVVTNCPGDVLIEVFDFPKTLTKL